MRRTEEGTIQKASAGTLALSKAAQTEFTNHFNKYRSSLIIRPQSITNHPEVLRRLGVIAVNSAVEVDIYGNANSTAVRGSWLLNGIGGSGDFTRNALISIMVLPSTRKGGKISTILPMIGHVDHTAHDIHVVVTEQGVADLRGKSPRERAQLLIENCAAPHFREPLMSYFKRACQKGGQWPHMLQEALSWYINYEETGSMK
ncbi:acetyl-CoA hydrolase/transferase C-terminal domain-containing protein [Salinicoccus albus]|uniref:acetyl-CoA hydrolase/transferase C-terminal domain-containing protein n=1 Tax=Salinicoccus albus TaxID=418756 RepID=UPI000A05C941